MGVTSVAIHPGGTRTEKTQPDHERRIAQSDTIGRIVDATEIAWLVTVLASPKSGAINGETISAGGGHTKGDQLLTSLANFGIEQLDRLLL